MNQKVIGYFAYATKAEIFCDGEACLIAGSESSMEKYLTKMAPNPSLKHTVRKTRFHEILKGISFGAAYSFDEESYNRFYPLAVQEGFNLGPEDFSGQTTTGFHFVRVQSLQPTDSKDI